MSTIISILKCKTKQNDNNKKKTKNKLQGAYITYI